MCLHGAMMNHTQRLRETCQESSTTTSQQRQEQAPGYENWSRPSWCAIWNSMITAQVRTQRGVFHSSIACKFTTIYTMCLHASLGCFCEMFFVNLRFGSIRQQEQACRALLHRPPTFETVPGQLFLQALQTQFLQSI